MDYSNKKLETLVNNQSGLNDCGDGVGLSGDLSVYRYMRRIRAQKYADIFTFNTALEKLSTLLQEIEGDLDCDKESCSEFMSYICEQYLTWGLVEHEVYEFDSLDFKGLPDCAVAVVGVCSQFLTTLKQQSNKNAANNVLKHCRHTLVAVCAANSKPLPWTNDKAIDLTENTLNEVCIINECGKTPQLLLKTSESQQTLASQLLFLLQSKLSRNTWKNNPICQHIFDWCLMQIKFPHLSDHLNAVIPPALLFTDDYVQRNKIQGIRCLHHIISNTTKTSLKFHARADVVYEALHHQLYTREVAVIEVLHPTLLSILSVVEHSSEQVDSQRALGKYDAILQHVLRDMLVEVNIVIRRSLSFHLPPYLKAMGIAIVRHLRQILYVISSYLETYDGPAETARINILIVLQFTITEAWPRMAYHCDDIVKKLLTFIYDVSVDKTLTPQDVRSRLLEEAVKCLKLLRRASKGRVEELLQCFKDDRKMCVNQICWNCVKRVLEE